MIKNGKKSKSNYKFLKLSLKLQSIKNTKNIWNFYKKTISELLEFDKLEIVINDSFIENKYEYQGIKSLGNKKETIFSIKIEENTIQISIIAANNTSSINFLKNITKLFFKHYILITKLKESIKLNIRDEITGLYNQKYLRESLTKEIEKGTRYKQNFSVVFFDLDGLSVINEKHGHMIGTKILIELAKIFKKHLRKSDIISRFGGDEFVFILFNTNKEQAISVCKRIKEKLTKHIFLKKENLKIKLTGSFGISIFPLQGNTAEELIKKADKAMYETKKQGKNGIKLFGG